MKYLQIVIGTYVSSERVRVYVDRYIHISRDLMVFRLPNWNLHSETLNPSHNSYNILGCIYYEI